MKAVSISIVSFLLLVLVANPTLVAMGQEEEESMEEETTETEMTEEESMEETTEESMEETTEEESMEETMDESMDETMEESMEESMEEMMEETMMEETMMETQSPRMQMEEGVAAADVVCKEGLDLLIKAFDGSAACVMPSSAEVLMARGWGSPA